MVEALVLKIPQQFAARVGLAPEVAQLVFILEELRQRAVDQFEELGGRHHPAIGAPEASGRHVLNLASLAIGQANHKPLARLSRFRLRLWSRRLGSWSRLRLGFRLYRLAVPLRIVEVLVRPNEVVDGEKVLAVVEARASPDDLLELNHGVDGAQQDDVADVAGVDAC